MGKQLKNKLKDLELNHLNKSGRTSDIVNDLNKNRVQNSSNVKMFNIEKLNTKEDDESTTELSVRPDMLRKTVVRAIRRFYNNLFKLH